MVLERDPGDGGAVRTTPPPCIDVLRILPELAQGVRTTVRLNPRRLAPGESLPRDVSKIGGDFLWPATEPWPLCPKHQLPWVAVLQLRKADFPEVEFRPQADLLQVLWCPRRGHGRYTSPEPILFWRDSTKIAEPLTDIPQPHLPTPAEEAEEREQSALEDDLSKLQLFATQPRFMRGAARQMKRLPFFSGATRVPRWFLEMPAETDEEFEAVRASAARIMEELKQHHRIPKYAEVDFVPCPCRLFPERIVEYPDLSEAQAALLATMPAPVRDAEEAAEQGRTLRDHYASELSAADGTKLQGYVNWSQVPEEVRCDRGHVMAHLLTIASAEWDGANWRRWLAAEEQDLYRRLSAARNWAATRTWHQPTGLMLGDQASKYLFICRQCGEWPVKQVMQD